MSDEPRRCSARSKRTGEQCGQVPPPGWDVCRWHGGGAPQVARAATERAAEAEARKAFGRMSEHAEPVTNPLDALATVAGEIVAWKDFCAGRIAELETLRSTDEKGAEQIDARISLFERSMDRALGALATVAKLGIEEKLARISQQQADQMLAVLMVGLAAAGVTGTRAEEARAASAREARRLRLVA